MAAHKRIPEKKYIYPKNGRAKSIFSSGPRQLFGGIKGYPEIMVNPKLIAQQMDELLGKSTGKKTRDDFSKMLGENIITVHFLGKLVRIKSSANGNFVSEVKKAIDSIFSKNDLETDSLKNCLYFANPESMTAKDEKELFGTIASVRGQHPYAEKFFRDPSLQGKAGKKGI